MVRHIIPIRGKVALSPEELEAARSKAAVEEAAKLDVILVLAKSIAFISETQDSRLRKVSKLTKDRRYSEAVRLMLDAHESERKTQELLTNISQHILKVREIDRKGESPNGTPNN